MRPSGAEREWTVAIVVFAAIGVFALFCALIVYSAVCSVLKEAE